MLSEEEIADVSLGTFYVFDKEYASFLSRYKTYALDQGRNFIVQVSTAF